jgi:uncharacterized protein YpmB
VCGEFLRSIFFRVMLSLFVVVVVAFLERKKESEEIQIQQKRENCDSLARELSLKQSDRADKWKPNNVLQHRNNNTWKIDR